MQGGSIFALSPSFSSYSSSKFAEVAAKVTEEFHEQREELGLEEDEWKPPQKPEKPEQSEHIEQQELQQELEEEQIQISSVDSIEKEKNKEKVEYEGENAEEDDDEEFEFAILSRDDSNTSPISADEIFANGQIKPIYPVFNRDLLFAGCEDDFTKLKNGSTIRLPLRKLMIQERDGASSSSSESDEIEALPDGTYCVWTPKPTQASPERCQKSNSTGSSKRWRFRDLLHRSNSDGKDTFVFLTRSNSVLKGKKKEKKSDNVEKLDVPKEKRDPGEVKDAGKVKSKGVAGEGTASAHEAHYVRNRARLESDRRRSYLPYRQDLVGLFANVNGLNRTLRPF